MKEIKLTRGKVALVDDEDFEELNKHIWNAHKSDNNYYASKTMKKGKKSQYTIFMHRVILGLQHGDRKYIDHINHNTLDNQKCNLRICTNQQNSFNRKMNKNKSSKYKGVYWSKYHKKWKSEIKYNGKHIFIIHSNSEVAAAKAYDEKAKELFGEYAYINKY